MNMKRLFYRMLLCLAVALLSSSVPINGATSSEESGGLRLCNELSSRLFQVTPVNFEKLNEKSIYFNTTFYDVSTRFETLPIYYSQSGTTFGQRQCDKDFMTYRDLCEKSTQSPAVHLCLGIRNFEYDFNEQYSFISPRNEEFNFQTSSPDELTFITGFTGNTLKLDGVLRSNDREAWDLNNKDFNCFVFEEVDGQNVNLSGTSFTDSYVESLCPTSMQDAYFENFGFRMCKSFTSLFTQTKNYQLKELKNISGDFRVPVSFENDSDLLDLSNFRLDSINEIYARCCNLENATISNSIIDEIISGRIVSTQSYKDKVFLGNTLIELYNPYDPKNGKRTPPEPLILDFTNFNLTGCFFRDCGDLTHVKFDGAIITNCTIWGKMTIEQVKSTWNWKHRQMDTVVFSKKFQQIVDEERKKEGF